MAYSTGAAATDAMRRAQQDLARQYNNKIPWSARKAFQDKWNPIVQQARLAEVKAQQNPAVPYTNYTPQQQQTYDTRINTAAEAAKANPSFPDPAPPPPPAPTVNLADQFAKQIAELQSGFQTQLSAQASQFADLQKQQESKAEEMQQQLMQAQSRQGIKPMVAGVRTAAAGAGMKIAGRASGDAFRRAGIQSKSINI